jgi:hypothetical protein
MFGLKVERSVAENPAGFDTFATSYTKFLINGVFEIRIFHKLPCDGPGGTELIFRAGIPGFSTRLEITTAEITISAHGIGVETFDGRVGKNTVCSATFALDAEAGIQLPHHFFFGGPAEQLCG